FHLSRSNSCQLERLKIEGMVRSRLRERAGNRQRSNPPAHAGGCGPVYPNLNRSNQEIDFFH
ncbi:MAG TPA: hypothetical protein VK892_11755, partial [Pyrinomonadaceae bacterium]|nr:hypothetical protein [Pyrinomonadaceae bacterium]